MADRGRAGWMIGIGVLVTLAGVLSYFFFFVRFPSLRDFPWFNLPLVALGLAISALGAWRAWRIPGAWGRRVLGSAGLALSLFLAFAFLAYVFVLSSMVPEPTATALELRQAPDFDLPSVDGRTVRLSDLRGSKVVLVFYRGFW